MKKILFFALLSFFSFQSLSSKAQCSAPVVELIGGSSALLMYNTYLSIGSIADMYVGDVMDKKRAQTLLDEQIAMIDNVISFYTKAVNDKTNSLSKEDKEFLKDIATTLNYLSNQAHALEKYTKSGSDADSKEYDQNRNAAWKNIEILLDLK